jgi:hypothetical protein
LEDLIYSPMFEFFDPRQEFVVRHGNLPHWFQPGVTYFEQFAPTTRSRSRCFADGIAVAMPGFEAMESSRKTRIGEFS